MSHSSIEARREYGRHRVLKNRKAGLCVCGRPRTENYVTCEACRKYKRQGYLKYKELLFDLKGRVCVCCGESELKFLTFDHINNDGAEHRKKRSESQQGVIRDMIEHPEICQILCHNCNQGRQLNGGICPHKNEKRA